MLGVRSTHAYKCGFTKRIPTSYHQLLPELNKKSYFLRLNTVKIDFHCTELINEFQSSAHEGVPILEV